MKDRRLIDANALVIEELLVMDRDYVDEFASGVRKVMNAIRGLPAVDAVEVVRCKDCKHYDNSEGICWCKINSKFYPGGLDWHSFPEDGFCSYGERKTDDKY